MSTITSQQIDRFLPQILSIIPAEWRGTTFNNSKLLGREGFVANFNKLVSQKDQDGGDIGTNDLVQIGNAEDYLRVSTNLSTILELALAADANVPVSQVFSFASENMGIIAVALTVGDKAVHVYHGADPAPLTTTQLEMLTHLKTNITCHKGNPSADANDNTIVLVTGSVPAEARANADGMLSSRVLTILNTTKLSTGDIFTIRKRMATPATTPVVEAMLQQRAGVEVTANTAVVDKAALAEFYSHLQTLVGTSPNSDATPVITAAGLPALNSFFTTLIATRGGADILMSSTAYGGCSQLTDIHHSRVPTFTKHTFDIQGIGTNIGDRIKGELTKLARDPSKLSPITVLFVEIPTNPDMKVPDLEQVSAALTAYKQITGKDVLLLVDATFAPNSQVMAKVKLVAPELNVMAFVSLSKSVSRGRTTGGAIIANHTDESIALVKQIAITAQTFDTTSKADQLVTLCDNHVGVEDRCKQAYAIARDSGEALVNAVRTATSITMPLAFVSPDSAAKGFTSSTFSFNLPSPTNTTPEINAGLAQRFVDLLCEHPEFKPCVSFGQDNGLTYCTVPATSTQGAIKDEDKAKQAVGGVQLTRLSFPPTCDTAKIQKVMCEAIQQIYARPN